MAEDMIERAHGAACKEYYAIEGDNAPLPPISLSRMCRAALLAALDPEDEALQQLWSDVIDRFSDPASHHCMATFFAELKAMAQGVPASQEQVREKD